MLAYMTATDAAKKWNTRIGDDAGDTFVKTNGNWNVKEEK